MKTLTQSIQYYTYSTIQFATRLIIKQLRITAPQTIHTCIDTHTYKLLITSPTLRTLYAPTTEKNQNQLFPSPQTGNQVPDLHTSSRLLTPLRNSTTLTPAIASTTTNSSTIHNLFYHAYAICPPHAICTAETCTSTAINTMQCNTGTLYSIIIFFYYPLV